MNRVVWGVSLSLLAGCAGRTVPADNAARPIQVELIASGWRADEVRYRVERLLVADPEIGLGAGTQVHANMDHRFCAIGFGIGGEGTAFGISSPRRVRDEGDFEDCMRRVIEPGVALLRTRLAPYRKARR
jgi:hypothetical protein